MGQNGSVMSASLYADAIAPFLKESERLRPAGVEVFDAHTHLGLDEDGRSLDLQTLLSQLDDGGARRACVFPLHDPERKPSYRVPNDRVLGWAGESDGRLIPFCRLDPAEAPVAEGTRCIEKGARGIKLHPRAQSFSFDGAEMDGDLRARKRSGGADLDPCGTRDAADRRRVGEPRVATPRGGADPRARSDLRPGDPHLALEGPPGGAVRHFVFLPARCDRVARACARGEGGVRKRPPLWAHFEWVVSRATRGGARRTRRDRHEGDPRRDDGGARGRPRATPRLPAARRRGDHAERSPRACLWLREPCRTRAVWGRDRTGTGDARPRDRRVPRPRPGRGGRGA